MLSRRDLVGKLTAGAALAAAASVGLPKAAAARRTAKPVAVAGQAGSELARVAHQLAAAPELVAAPAPEMPVAVGTATMPASPPPWELVRPLAAGSPVAHGWRVADLSGVADGSCVLTLQNGRGRTQRVHVCRNDGRPQGLVYTERFDLVVMNGGQGDLPTEEGLAQAVAAVAHALAANDSERHAPVVVALLPQGERVRRFASAMEHKLR